MGSTHIEIKKLPGVYVLIFHLNRPKKISVGRFGKLKFEAGWYAYVGSSCLPGGLRNRTDRHKRHGKKNHWHVDYFREHADLVEIWFSHLGAKFEHQWAKTFSKLSWAHVPIAKFGSSDCKDGCPAHFFRFNRRPTVSLLRALNRASSSEPVLVQRLINKEIAALDGAEWEQDFWLGSTILEASRMDLYAVDESAPDCIDIGKVTYNVALSSLIDDYAKKLSVKRVDVQDVVAFAAAVNQLIEHLGHDAFEVLFLANQKQKRDHILEISRKSVERQAERFEKVKNGKAKSVAPIPGDDAPDTMKFSKFFSRLGRARGAVIQVQLFRTSRANMSPEDETLISKKLSSYPDELFEFRRQIQLLAKRPDELKTTKGKRKETKPAKSVKQLKIQVCAGLGMLKKNNRDLPRSSYDLRPTPGQHKRVIEEIDELIEMVEPLLE